MPNSWLPILPFELLIALPVERQQVYVSRMIDRTHLGGWLIQRKEQGDADGWTDAARLFFGQVERSHVPTRIAENDQWLLVWYDYVGADSRVRRPDLGGTRLPPLPRDLLVDGNPISGSVLPSIWGLFGPEWSEPVPNQELREADTPATVLIYTPQDVQTMMVMSLTRDGLRRSLSATVDGGPPTLANISNDTPIELPLALKKGWNTVTLTVGPRQSRHTTSSETQPGENEKALEDDNQVSTRLRVTSIDIRT